jgi:ABC-type nitrate/sulfonate/bicarbonate transport system permease component
MRLSSFLFFFQDPATIFPFHLLYTPNLIHVLSLLADFVLKGGKRPCFSSFSSSFKSLPWKSFLGMLLGVLFGLPLSILFPFADEVKEGEEEEEEESLWSTV